MRQIKGKRFLSKKALVISIPVMMFVAGLLAGSPSPVQAANPLVQQILELLSDPLIGLQSITDRLVAIEAGLPPPCVESEEICDGIDNDCDDVIDEGFDDLGQVCLVGIGACQDGGFKVCSVADPTRTVCNAVAGFPSAEACDGFDNDCDGAIDNFTTPTCTIQQGVCAGTTQSCAGSAGLQTCGLAEFGPDFEPNETTCDGLDNDCDGTVDNLAFATFCAAQEGVCAGSTQVCAGSAGLQACGATEFGPNYEDFEFTCDGLDNDCDGLVDEGCL